MPNERRCKVPRRVLDMDDASVRGARRGTRGMKEQGTEGEDGALGGKTQRLRVVGANAINRLSSQPAETMRTTDDSHWSIVDGARIEMQANGEHVLENVCRRLNVRHASLLRPRSIVGHIAAFLSGDGEILVPDHLPVRVGSLVEEQCADRKAGVAKYSRGKLSQSGRRGERRRRSRFLP